MTVLVVGDVMIDSGWVVNEHASVTAQPHGDVAPRARATPGRITERLGGAGGTAAALWKLDSDVVLLGRWAGRDQSRLMASFVTKDNNPLRTVKSASGRTLKLVGLAAPWTTTKFRVYISSSGRTPELKYRFDQELQIKNPLSGTDSLLDNTHLPKSNDLDAVVVMDFAKGFVSRDLLTNLRRKYPSALWFVDTKMPRTVETLNELRVVPTVVTFNRDELVLMLRFFGAKEGLIGGVPTGAAARLCRHDVELERAVVEALSFLGSRLQSTSLVAKLDADGVIARCSDGVYWRVKPRLRQMFDGVCAGDVFMACLVSQHLEGTELPDSIKRAHETAARWLCYSEKTFWDRWDPLDDSTTRTEQPDISRWNPRSDKDEATKSDGTPRAPNIACSLNLIGPKARVTERCKAFFNLTAMLDVREPSLDLEVGRQLVGTYIATRPSTRRDLRRIAGRMLEYFEGPDPKHPLTILIRAHPGSGKSYLADQLAAAVGGQKIPVNSSQMATTTDLLNAIADVATVYAEVKRPVLFLDEVDALIGGSALFALLLSVLWEGEVRVFPRTYHLPRKLVVICAASKSPRELRKLDKYRDFESRVNGGSYTLEQPNELDRALLAGAALRRYQPGILSTERGFIDMIISANRSSARDVERIVEGVRLSNDGRLRKANIGGELLRNVFSWPDSWTQKEVRVAEGRRVIPVTVVGAGNILTRYLQATQVKSAESSLEITRVVDTSGPYQILRNHPELAQRKHRLEVSQTNGTPEELLALLAATVTKGAVVVATPTPTHFPYVRACLDAGLVVGIEKPYVARLDEARSLDAWVRDHSDNRLFHFGYYLLEKGLPLVPLAREGIVPDAYLKELLPRLDAADWANMRRGLGHLRSISGCIFEGIGRKSKLLDRQWVLEPQSGGISFEQLYHLVCLVLLWSGPDPIKAEKLVSVDDVLLLRDSSTSSRIKTTDRELAETFTIARLTLGGATPVVIGAGKYVPEGLHERWMRLTFEYGTVMADFETRIVTIEQSGQTVEVGPASGEPYSTQWRLFEAKVLDPHIPSEYFLSYASVLLTARLRKRGLMSGIRLRNLRDSDVTAVRSVLECPSSADPLRTLLAIDP
jgi:sugar/nucleoside kinase (ribokinase family)